MFLRITSSCFVLTVLLGAVSGYGQLGDPCQCQQIVKCYKQPGPLLTDKQLENVKSQLKIDEGYREYIYKDSRGYPTFGIGHLISKGDPEYGKPVGTGVSKKRIDEAFKADIEIAMKDVIVIFPKAKCYPAEVKEILVNMAFNLGRTTLLKFEKFIAAVKARNWEKAAAEMVDSRWYRQVGDRAKRLVGRMKAVK